MRFAIWSTVALGLALILFSSSFVAGSASAARRCTITGKQRDDVIRGTLRADVICALDGNDVIDGLSGNDVIDGGGGSDVIRGGGGNDQLFGGSGRGDELRGGPGKDLLDGAAGNDILYPDSGVDRVIAGEGDDLILALDSTRDDVDGGPGYDSAQSDGGAAGDRRRGIERSFPTAAGADPVVIAAGDISACESAGDEQTAPLLDVFKTATVITLGDNVYEQATLEAFRTCYEPTWGRAKTRTRPAIGSHEYYTEGAAGYFEYFGAAAGEPGKGWYSFDLGSWHVVVLNAICAQVGSCGATSPQGQWLAADLAAHPSKCTLAVSHLPRFSTRHGHPRAAMLNFWQTLHRHGAELMLSGDDHVYERFAPQTPDGAPDPATGIRQFVVGTGGRSHHRVSAPAQPNSEVKDTGTYGVLKLTLGSESYAWEFVAETGKRFSDSGTTACH